MFKTNLDFANLCLYNELDEISCCFIFCDVWELSCISTRHKKIKNTIVRNSFSPVVYTACNITHIIEKPIAALSVSSETFFRWFYMKEHNCLCTTEIIPPFAQNGTFYSAIVLYKVKRRHCYCTPCSVCNREKFDQFNISLNYVYKYPVSIRYCWHG